MCIAEQIVEYVRSIYNDKKVTQDELATLWGVSQNYVCRILSGKADPERISVAVLQRIFPKATLNINGCSAQSVSGVGVVVGEHISDVAINATGNAEKMTAIKNAILDSETLGPEAKVEVLKIIKSVE